MIHKIPTNFYYGSLDLKSQIKLLARLTEADLSQYEASPQELERRERNSYRGDILTAITLIEDRLEELGEITRDRCLHLTALRNEIAADMED